MPDPLTPRQAEILAFIRQFAEEHGYSPVRREIASRFRMSPNGAQHAVKALEAKGWLVRAPGIPRGLRVVDTSQLSEQPETS